MDRAFSENSGVLGGSPRSTSLSRSKRKVEKFPVKESGAELKMVSATSLGLYADVRNP